MMPARRNADTPRRAGTSKCRRRHTTVPTAATHIIISNGRVGALIADDDENHFQRLKH